MAIIPDDLRQRLLENGRANWRLSEQDNDTTDVKPLVKLFDPCGAATWLIIELNPEDDDLAFGLCDLGIGFPELGSARISELDAHKGPLGIGIGRDVHFEADNTLSAYAKVARISGRIEAKTNSWKQRQILAVWRSSVNVSNLFNPWDGGNTSAHFARSR